MKFTLLCSMAICWRMLVEGLSLSKMSQLFRWRHDIPSLKLTAIAPENRPGRKRKVVPQAPFFRGELLVSGSVTDWLQLLVMTKLNVTQSSLLSIRNVSRNSRSLIMESQRWALEIGSITNAQWDLQIHLPKNCLWHACSFFKKCFPNKS